MLKLKIYGFIIANIITPWIGYATELEMKGKWFGFFAVIFAPFIALAIIASGVMTLIKKITHPRWR